MSYGTAPYAVAAAMVKPVRELHKDTVEVKPPEVEAASWFDMLLPHEQKPPSLWHPILRYRWKRMHERIFRLERDHGYVPEKREIHHVLPWTYALDHGDYY